MGFGKFLKKAVKLGGKIAKPLLAATPAGAIALRAQQTFKALGGNLKAARLGKIQPLSVRAPIEKVAAMAPAKRIQPRSTQGDLFRGLTRAPLTGMTGFKLKSGKAKRSRMPQKRQTANGKPKRTPPPGGLDLKAMAAQWRAAGKPGTWIGWIKANQIRKP